MPPANAGGMEAKMSGYFRSPPPPPPIKPREVFITVFTHSGAAVTLLESSIEDHSHGWSESIGDMISGTTREGYTAMIPATSIDYMIEAKEK